MSELPLGAPDLVARPGGLRRHQFVCAALAATSATLAVLAPHGHRSSLVLVALATLALATPLAPGLTLGTAIWHGLRSAVGPRWVDTVTSCPAAILTHRGRLDLGEGLDARCDEAASLLEARSHALAPQGLSWSVHQDRCGARTVLVTGDEHFPPSWRRDDGVLELLRPSREHRVRRNHLRGVDGVTRVLRVEDVGGPPSRALVALQSTGVPLTLTLHVRPVSSGRATRLVGRAVHRRLSDAAASSRLGFRSSARHGLTLARLRWREEVVSQGRALVKASWWVVVSAPDRVTLDDAVRRVRRHTRDAGVRLDAGWARQGAWWLRSAPTALASTSMTHFATSADRGVWHLPLHDAGTGLAGRPLGRAHGGGDFVHDPFDAYAAGLCTNPNVLVVGAIGAGKSTLVKMSLERALERGRRVVVIDPKGEYDALARAHGTRAIVLGRDGWCDPFPEDELDARGLVRSLLCAARGRPLSDEEHFALDRAWPLLGSPRPRRLLHALVGVLAPNLEDGPSGPARDLALTARRFIDGDLAGLFDGGSPPLRFDGQLIVLDLSRQWGTATLGLAALAAVAAAQRVIAPGRQGHVVIDEAWALLDDPAALSWLQGSWKLARARGISHLVVLHRLSDVAAVGDAGSAQRARAQGLARECENVWLFRQDGDEAREMAAALELHPREERLLPRLSRGTVLVRYGAARSVVTLLPSPQERHLIDTDASMRLS